MSKGRIIVVEDEFVTGADIQAKLEEMGYEVPFVADTGELAIKKTDEERPDLVLMDIHLKDRMTGIEAAEVIHDRYGIPVIFLTGQSDESTVEKAKMSSPFGYLIKPVDDRALKISINMALYKHQMDESLKRQEQTIVALLNATTDALFIVDHNGSILALNETLAKRAGKRISELIGTPFLELIPAGAISVLLAEKIREGMGGRSLRFEEEVAGKWFDNNIYPIAESSGNVMMIAIFSNDITIRKQIEAQVLEANKSLKKERENLLVMSSAIDTMDDIVIITDATGNIEYVNSGFTKKIGYAPGEVMNKHIGDLQNPGDPYAVDKNAFISRSKDAWTGKVTLKSKYGLKIKTSLRSSPVIKDNRLICRTFVLREEF
jgi:PAS domain S-box-containing protein